MVEQYRQGLDAGKQQARASLGMIGNKYTVDWSKYAGNDWTERVRGGGDLARLKALGERAVRFPENFTLHPRVAQVMANRAKMFRGEMPLDWGCGRDAGLRQHPRRRQFDPHHRPGLAAAARSSIATPCCTTRPPASATCRSQHLAERQPRVPGDRLGAVRRGRARLRIRLLDHRSRPRW